MASSAVYRYFASRDELLTALIIDAYDAVGAAAEQAPSRASRNPSISCVAVGYAVRDWALAEPHQWALIYGSPVPGYQAPQDTIGPATRVIMLIAAIVRDAYAAGRITTGPPITGRYAEELAAVGAQFGPGIPPQLVAAPHGRLHPALRRGQRRAVRPAQQLGRRRPARLPGIPDARRSGPDRPAHLTDELRCRDVDRPAHLTDELRCRDVDR